MDFLVPKLSATMEQAKVLRWLKQPGDKIRSGEALVELETDKAAMEVESPVDGVLEEILVGEGADVAVGAKLAEIGEAGGSATTAPVETKPRPTAAPAPPPVKAPVAPPARPAPAVPPRAAPPPPAARILASPLARRLARERGVDLAVLARTKTGRIRKADVLAATGAARAPASATRPSPVPAHPATDAAAEPLTPMRARIAETVTLSRQTIPAFTLDRFVSTEAVARARAELGPAVERDAGVKLTLTDFLLQALADALGQNPVMLQRFADASGRPGSVRHGQVDIGLVVAVEGGMMIPVLPDLGGRSLAEVGVARRDAVQRVRSGRLVAGDGAPVPIALSNLSRGGADRFEAIIGPGQSSVLAVGREHEAVVARGGMPVVTTGVHLTLSVDHRLIDGVVGATFLGQLADRIEFGPWQS
ncbi:MAG TPA: dihydrolipoamide acetyltransferase family protein [Bauldia sp.]|nr:dihydrolipoamide acetyltransferase family protein [Bauldia sp.]